MSLLRSVSRASALRFEKIPSFFFSGGGGGGGDEGVGTDAGAGLVAFGASSDIGFGGDGGCCFGSPLLFVN